MPRSTFSPSRIVPLGLFHENFGLLSPEKSQQPHSRATMPTVHAWCFRVSIIHRTLTWTTGSLKCAKMFIHAIAHRVAWTHVRDQKHTRGEKERFLFGQYKTKCANFRESPFFRSYVQHKNKRSIFLSFATWMFGC